GLLSADGDRQPAGAGRCAGDPADPRREGRTAGGAAAAGGGERAGGEQPLPGRTGVFPGSGNGAEYYPGCSSGGGGYPCPAAGRHCAAGGNYRRRVGSGGSGDSVGAGGVGPFSRAGAERRGVLCTPFAAGALLLQVGVAVVAGVRQRSPRLALGSALYALRSGGAAPTGWGRRVGVEWGCCPYG